MIESLRLSLYCGEHDIVSHRVILICLSIPYRTNLDPEAYRYSPKLNMGWFTAGYG